MGPAPRLAGPQRRPDDIGPARRRRRGRRHRRGRRARAALARRRGALPQRRALAASGLTMASVLAIDCGNSLMKWGLHRDGAWIKRDGVPLGAIVRLEPQWRDLGPVDRIVVSNVAGHAVGIEIDRLSARWTIEPIRVVPGRSQCGVVNGYERPERLGADRWAALIGARALEPGACLVVDAGTATTVDMLSAEGTFTGGAILPGVSLMKRALAQHAAQLPLAEGRLVPEPRHPPDPIQTGVPPAP